MSALKRRTTLDVCLELYDVNPDRERAIEYLAATFPEAQRAGVRARWQSSTLDGTPVAEVDAEVLTLEAVMLSAWSLDRHHRGLLNIGCWQWYEAARAAQNIVQNQLRVAA